MVSRDTRRTARVENDAWEMVEALDVVPGGGALRQWRVNGTRRALRVHVAAGTNLRKITAIYNSPRGAL